MKYGEKLSTQLKADHMQRIVVRFGIKDYQNKKNLKVHQAFIRFTNSKTGSQCVLVAEQDSQNNYKLDMVHNNIIKAIIKVLNFKTYYFSGLRC